MQATFSPISFNGKLGDALEAKQSVLEMKLKNAKAKEGSQQTYDQEVNSRSDEISQLYKQAKQAKLKGQAEYDELIQTAKGDRADNKSEAKITYAEGVINSVITLIETREKTDELVAAIKEVAADNERLAEKAKQDLKDIGKTAKPLRAAASKLANNTISEAREVSDSVKSAQKAVIGATNAVQGALEEVKTLEAKERVLEAQYKEIAAKKKGEAKSTKKSQYAESKAECLARLAELKEEKAQALDKAKEAYRSAVDNAKQVLEEYKDQSDHDRVKANNLSDQIVSMELQVLKIKAQAMFTRATNLPNLAAATIGLGKMGEGATGSVAGRILKTLQHTDWLATIKGKLGAISAAKLFLQEGSENQKTVMSTGLEMNAPKIVDKTESAEVLEKLADLDKVVDTVA